MVTEDPGEQTTCKAPRGKKIEQPVLEGQLTQTRRKGGLQQERERKREREIEREIKNSVEGCLYKREYIV